MCVCMCVECHCVRSLTTNDREERQKTKTFHLWKAVTALSHPWKCNDKYLEREKNHLNEFRLHWNLTIFSNFSKILIGKIAHFQFGELLLHCEFFALNKLKWYGVAITDGSSGEANREKDHDERKKRKQKKTTTTKKQMIFANLYTMARNGTSVIYRAMCIALVGRRCMVLCEHNDHFIFKPRQK